MIMKSQPVQSDSQRPMVLHTRVVTGTGGGPEKTILNSPRFLRPYGLDCSCLFMRPPGDPGFAALEQKAQTCGADILGVDDRGPLDLHVIRECLRICRERQVTIWHAHDYKSNALGLALRRFHPMHLVTTAHGWVRFTSRTPLYYRIDRFCLKRYDQVICVSQDLQKQCQELGVQPDRLQLIENAIVLDDYSTAPPTTTDRIGFGCPSTHLLLGAAGRLSEEKGFHHLIHATARLIREGFPLGLVIAGDGHLREPLQRLIDAQDLQSHIRLAGFLPDTRTLYRAIDLFVLSSLREGLPNVVLEAMASARPVIATNCNGIPQVLTDGENGLLVRTDCSESLYRAIRTCCESELLRQRLAQAGRRTMEERFSFDRRMQKVVQVYRNLSAALAETIPSEVSRPAALPADASRLQKHPGAV